MDWDEIRSRIRVTRAKLANEGECYQRIWNTIFFPSLNSYHLFCRLILHMGFLCCWFCCRIFKINSSHLCDNTIYKIVATIVGCGHHSVLSGCSGAKTFTGNLKWLDPWNSAAVLSSDLVRAVKDNELMRARPWRRCFHRNGKHEKYLEWTFFICGSLTFPDYEEISFL